MKTFFGMKTFFENKVKFKSNYNYHDDVDDLLDELGWAPSFES